jgi:hypothetical protein
LLGERFSCILASTKTVMSSVKIKCLATWRFFVTGAKFDETGVDFYFVGLLVGEEKNGTFSVFDAYPISHSRVTAASL